MRKELIIEKEGYKLKISVSLHDSGYGLRYRFDWIQILPKKKRKWQSLTNEWKYEYQYRNMPYEQSEQRSEYIHKKYLEYLTEDDIIYIKRQMLNCICDELNPESDQNATFVAR